LPFHDGLPSKHTSA
jgi:hypothetical protein